MTKPAREKPRFRVPAGRVFDAHAAVQASGYRGAGSSQALTSWQVVRQSADADFLPDQASLVARARDLVRNEPAAAAAVQRAADLTVGHRFALAAKPDGEALGLDKPAARALSRALEREWRAWAEDPRRWCDRQRRLPFSGLLQLLAAQNAGPEGEALAVLGFDTARVARGARYATCVEVVDPDRLSNPHNALATDTLRAGVEFDVDGAPLAYHLRKRHPIDVGISPGGFVWERVPAETPWGRPVVLHWFEATRAGQTRGISRFAPLLTGFRQLSQLTEAELSNALLNALFGAFVKTGSDASSIAAALSTESEDYFSTRVGFYAEHPVQMNGVRVPVLAPGDEVQVNTSPRQTGDFVAFRAAFLATVAATVGLSYEQLSMDFSKTNYSSARAALNEVWRTVQARRAGLVGAVVAPIYYAVIEEAFERGYLVEPPGAPRFEDRPDAYLRALWIGPSRGSVDPVKDFQAIQLGWQVGAVTLEQACAEHGLDWEDVLEQQAHEQAVRAGYGLAPAAAAIVTEADDPSTDETADPNEPPGALPNQAPPNQAPPAPENLVAFAPREPGDTP